MKFTIAIPVYNGEKSVVQTIESALNQDYSFEYEILISNNGSKDNTEKVIEPYLSKIKVISRTDTVPMYENHNICLREAQGDYVVFCHADDLLLEDTLSKFHTILENRKFPHKYVLWGRSMFRDFYDNWKLSGLNLNTILSGQKAIIPFLVGGLAPSGVCYSRAALLATGGFCHANLRLTPFDMTTMLKMAIDSFEFEMVDRLFFIRKFATTAGVLNTKLVKESVYDAFLCLQQELEPSQFSFLVNAIIGSKVYDPFVFNFLVKQGLLPKSYTRKQVIKKVINSPRLLFYRYFYNEISGII